MENDLIYQLALTQVPHIGHIRAKALIEHFGTAAAVFKAHTAHLEAIGGIGPAGAMAIRAFRDHSRCEQEIRFMEKYSIRPLFLTDPAYPQRLLHCADAPILLFCKGRVDLNAARTLSIIGTRSNTSYGRQLTETLVNQLAALNVLIISGLAFGIDVLAHKAALKEQLPTVGVLAHGLDTVYPAQHKQTAKDIISEEGGLLTEFPSLTQPDKHNFPARNRIVAGMSDAVIVVETGIKGGSMITAELANSYSREVFAFPGRINDPKSAGCHHLIRHHQAVLLTDTQQLIEAMGWQPAARPAMVAVPPAWVSDEPAQQLLQLFAEKETVHIDELNVHSPGGSNLAALLLNLELQGIVQSLPGKRYRLLTPAVIMAPR